MAPMTYVGKRAVQDTDVAAYGDATPLKPNSITLAEVTSAINNRMANYITTPAVDSALGNYKTKSSFTTDKGTLVPKTWSGIANGVASLDADGQVPTRLFPPRATSPKVTGLYTASSWTGYTGSVNGVLGTISIPSLGFPYRVLFWGSFEARGQSASARRPEVYVKDSSNRIIGFGAGRSDSNFHQVVVNPYCGSLGYGLHLYSGAQTFSVVGGYSTGIGTGNVEYSLPHNGANHYSGVVALVVPSLT